LPKILRIEHPDLLAISALTLDPVGAPVVRHVNRVVSQAWRSPSTSEVVPRVIGVERDQVKVVQEHAAIVVREQIRLNDAAVLVHATALSLMMHEPIVE
jgi:hypothetical protein